MDISSSFVTQFADTNMDGNGRQLKYPVVHGYRIGEEIGGGGFSKYIHPRHYPYQADSDRVFRAIDDTNSKVAACKVVNLFISPSLGVGTPNIKELQKEVQVHKSLKNQYILEFLHSEILDKEKEKEGWIPGLYLILELAVGGDLFDKIGTSTLS
jgi:serine/threonine-protein kinase Chk1